ncbi:MAG: NAD-dependent epimerase/dehydratase family protein [Verrucomicrobiota bacterium]
MGQDPDSQIICVTGAAGFIGSHTVERLLAAGHRVIGIDNFDPYYPFEIKQRNLSKAIDHPNFRFEVADITQMRSFERALDGESLDAMIHLAAKAGVRPSLLDPIGVHHTNVDGTQNCLLVAKDHQVAQFVFASSSSVYGVNPNVPWSESDAVLRPISPYAASKVCAELLGHTYAHLYGIRFIGLRFFTVFGPRQRPDLAIHKFANRILKGEPISVFGDGSTRRDYTYIDDIVDGVVSALHYDANTYALFNLGNNQTVSLNQMIETLEAALGVKAIRDYQPEQPGDVPQTWADLEKSRHGLRYTPKTSFAEGIQQFCSWYQNL